MLPVLFLPIHPDFWACYLMHRRLKVGIGLFGFFTCCRSTLFMTQSPFVHFLVLLLHATRISGRPLPPLSFYAVHSNIKTHTNFGLSRHTIFSRINEDPFGLSFDAGESLLRMHTSFAAFLIGSTVYVPIQEQRKAKVLSPDCETQRMGVTYKDFLWKY